MKTLIMTLAFVLAGAVGAPALGQTRCAKHQQMLDLLATKYQEAPIAVGVTNSGGLVEVLTDGKGGTWTIIVTTPQGNSCLVAAGDGWRSVAPVSLDPKV